MVNLEAPSLSSEEEQALSDDAASGDDDGGKLAAAVIVVVLVTGLLLGAVVWHVWKRRGTVFGRAGKQTPTMVTHAVACDSVEISSTAGSASGQVEVQDGARTRTSMEVEGGIDMEVKAVV